jgi:hypothetical protein
MADSLPKSSDLPPPDDGLTEPQHKAIATMLSEPTLGRVAEIIGVSERTIYNWLHTTKFKHALFAARRESFEQAIGLAQRAATSAVATLVKIMSNPKEQAGQVRIMAAKYILDFGRSAIELNELVQKQEEMQERLARVEEAAAAEKNRERYGETR